MAVLVIADVQGQTAEGYDGMLAALEADMKDAPEVVIPAEALKVAEYSRACPPEVQELYTKIWTELQK